MSFSAPVLYPPPPPPPPLEPPPIVLEPSTPPTGRIVTIVCWVLIWIVAIGLLTLTTIAGRREAKSKSSPGLTPSPQFVIVGKMAVGQAAKAAAAGPGNPSGQTPQQTPIGDPLLNSAGDAAKTPVDRLALVTVLYECRGSAKAIDQLDKELPHLAGNPSLLADANLLRKIYTTGPDSIGPVDRDKLQKQLGWFGELALTQNQPNPGPHRAQLLEQAGGIVTGLMLAGVAVIAGGGLGFVAMITAIVLTAVGLIRPALIRPSPGGPPRMLLLFTVWIYGFLGSSLLIGRLFPKLPVVMHEFAGFAWTAILVVLFSREITWSRWRRTLGLHSGKGIFLEMLCGAGGYLAGLPLVAASTVVMFFLMKISGVEPKTALSDELVAPLSAAKIAGLILAAGVMAPLIEETVFRGALYGHMRRRWHPVASGAIVGLIFAMIHPQGWTVVPVLATIGFVLAMLREWRGSLVASITAHGIHNTALVILAVSLLK